MADSLFASIGRARDRAPWLALDLPERFGLVTLHRPALVDDPERLGTVLEALHGAGSDVPFLFPIHPRTQATLRNASLEIGSIRLVDPMDYLDFIALEERAAVVVTDSGGVQEETSLLGTWCVTVRENTERPITVTHGTNTLVGFDIDRMRVAVDVALGKPSCAPAQIPLWDGHAADRIVDILLQPHPSVAFVPPTLADIEHNALDVMFS